MIFLDVRFGGVREAYGDRPAIAPGTRFQLLGWAAAGGVLLKVGRTAILFEDLDN